MTLQQLARHHRLVVAAFWGWAALCGIAGGFGVAVAIELIHRLRPRRAA